MLSTSTSGRRRSHFDVDPDTYTRIMHAHTRAQLAATTSPPVVSASPHATTLPAVAAAKVTTPPTRVSVPPIRVSDDKAIVVEAPSNGSNGSGSDSDSDSSDGAGTRRPVKRRSPAEFDAKNLHIPVRNRSPEEARVGGGGAEGQEQGQGQGKGKGRRKSEGAAMALMGSWGVGRAVRWEGGEEGGLCEEAVGLSVEGREKARRGSAGRHAPTRLKCDCDDCEGCRVRKGALARNGFCMGAAVAGRRESV